MGQMIELKAADGHTFGAYSAGPKDAATGLVVLQEIFGVNQHMRHVCDAFAEAGYAVISPAVFDRAACGVELSYDEAGIKRGLELRAQITEAATLADIEATAAALGQRPIGIVGYCWGGTIAWWGATRTKRFGAAVGWYGGGIAAERQQTPHCPVQLHFGETDHGIPLSDVEAIRAAQPAVEVYTYAGAGHGFGCDERGSYNAAATAEAQTRTLAFFAKHLAR
jgi:carboxymethylenebutenolidase